VYNEARRGVKRKHGDAAGQTRKSGRKKKETPSMFGDRQVPIRKRGEQGKRQCLGRRGEKDKGRGKGDVGLVVASVNLKKFP